MMKQLNDMVKNPNWPIPQIMKQLNDMVKIPTDRRQMFGYLQVQTWLRS